jgi:glucose/arabinose dehydrogenase
MRPVFWLSSPLLLIACGLSIAVPACQAQHDPPSKGRNIGTLYTASCAGCHGAEMSGASAPNLVTGPWRYGGDDLSIARSIREKHAAGKFAETLNGAEIRGLVILIRERRAQFEHEHTTYHAPTAGMAVKTEKASFQLEPVIEKGLAEPWTIAFLPDGRELVTERPGRLRVIEGGKLMPDAVRGIPAVFGGEGGLLDVKLDPNYGRPGQDWIYLSYGDKSADGKGMAAVIRGRLRGGVLVDQQTIFRANAAAYREGGQRFGSRLLFDGRGHLYFSEGDRAHPGDEQDLSHPNGKIHRVMEDGSIPKDNPFVNQKGALPSIWTYGHRNPQGLAFNPATGNLWELEHGPRGGDELNIIRPGRNYGWPVTTYGMNYDGTPITGETSRPGMEQPVMNWVPSIATSGITFYTGDRIPEWKGNLFVASLAAQELRRLELRGNSVTHQEILFKGIGRVRDIVNGPDGYLYVVLNQPDRIMRLAPARK